MESRKLGNLQTVVSAIGIGAMSFSDFYGPTDTEKSHAILTAALDLGIDHIDTSNVYGAGVSEERIGLFLAKQGPGGASLFKIATKAGIARSKDGSRLFDNSAEHLAAELDKSLQRLGVDQVELFYVHRRDPDIEIEEVTETLVGVRHIRENPAIRIFRNCPHITGTRRQNPPGRGGAIRIFALDTLS